MAPHQQPCCKQAVRKWLTVPPPLLLAMQASDMAAQLAAQLVEARKEAELARAAMDHAAAEQQRANELEAEVS